MSAIAAVFFLDGRPVARADIDRIVARLAHRRPTTRAVWSEGGVGLGPHDATWEGLRLTADTRLDNRAELCSVLRAPSHSSDGDIILRAYARWGEDCVKHLLGDFAFAIWDAHRRVLFCARDHMGVKPFYYHHRPGRLFACASEIKGLLALGDVPRTLNETRVADYLTPVLEDPAITFYDGIVRLPAAHRLVITARGARLERYWQLDSGRETGPASDAACADRFRELFTVAVHDRLRSERPVGALLSGGLDSSSIACVARDLLAGTGHRLPTFSALFPNVPSMDERAFIDAVLATGGFDPAFVRADQLSPLTDVTAMLRAEDEPFYAPNLYMHWALYARAAAAGVGVMLDGFDGDTTVSHGILRLTELARAGRWGTAVAEARGIAPGLDASAWRLLRDYCVRPCVPGPVRGAWRRLRDWIPGRHSPNRVQLVAPALAERVGLPQRLSTLLGARSQRALTVRADQFRQLASGLLPFVLEVAERAAAAFGIEARFPFFDIRLVEFCLALPSDQKLRHGWTRSIARRAMHGILPPAVQWRRDKTNLFPHFIDALRRQERALLDRIVLDPPVDLAGYVDLDALRDAYARYRAQPMEHDALAVWRAVTLALWLEQQVSVPSTPTGGRHHEHRQDHPAGQRAEAAIR